MTDYAANYTDRIRLSYSSLGRTHKMLWRISDTTEGLLVTGANELANFLNALNEFRFTDWTVIGWEYSLQNTNFFVPFSPSTVIDPGEAPITPPYDANVFLGFQGISTLGNRASVFVFGINQVPQTGTSGDLQDYRIYASEDARIQAAISELNLATVNVAIDDTNVTWKNYANIGYNAYWQRKSRSS